MVDHAVLAFGAAQGDQLLNDLRDRIGIGANGAGAWAASQRSHTATDELRLLVGPEGNERLFQGDQRLTTHGHPSFLSEIERHYGNFLDVDIEPDIQLGPIRKWEDTNAFTRPELAVEQSPYFGTLIFGVPLALGVTKRVDPLFGPRPFFVASRAANGSIEAALLQGGQHRLGLQKLAAPLRSQAERIGPFRQGFFVSVNDQARS